MIYCTLQLVPVIKGTSIFEANMPNEGPCFSGASVFYPKPQQAAKNLVNATLFTRINILATPALVAETISASPDLHNPFCLGHMNNVLIFDTNESEHHSHVRILLQLLRDQDMKADIERCFFDKPNWTEAGFYIDPIGKGDKQAFIVLLKEHIADE